MEDFSDSNYLFFKTYYESEKKCFIERSQLHNLGCFAKTDISENEFITHFPGHRITSPLHYEYAIEWRSSAAPDAVSYFVDPFMIHSDLSIGCGHLINSSHPALQPPFNEPNCDFVWRSKYPYIAIYSKDVYIRKGTELLLDYHYMLTHRVPLVCSCDICDYEKFDDFIRKPYDECRLVEGKDYK
jgi:hypothetical protein